MQTQKSSGFYAFLKFGEYLAKNQKGNIPIRLSPSLNEF